VTDENLKFLSYKMVLPSLRNYFAERLAHLKRDWKIFQSSGFDPRLTQQIHTETDLNRLETGIKCSLTSPEIYETYKSEASTIEHILRDKNAHKGFPAEFYLPMDIHDLPSDRIPPSGIIPLPFRFMSSQVVTATDKIPETGFQIDARILRIVNSKYPEYKAHIHKYVRPLGTTNATVADFFKPQNPTEPIDPIRKERILSLILRALDVSPYLPVHFVDSLHDRTPLHTGTGYHNRHSWTINAHALFSAPKEYLSKHTSKGYYINAFLESARSLIHHIKMYGHPFRHQPSDLKESLRKFFLERPTMLFTRNHISDKDGRLKQRPVYAVDDLFIRLESMITFPAHVLARKISCCIMYGFETIRGANRLIDRIAQLFKSFSSMDWSAFDQRMPRNITDIFWTDFLERLIIINHGYTPTYDYPSYPDLTPDMMFTRISNILSFLHTWYNNMVFVTADGYAYARKFAGVPSGLLNTQYLDSFCNLFLLFDGLIEYGCNDSEIEELFILVLGDDNVMFTNWSISKLDDFVTFFESYALSRHGMVLSKTKSLITVMRNRIETLGYSCNFGFPTRPLGKLVAQMCYPERGPKRKYTSARAIGLAYAACAMDSTFHSFCRDIYYEFLDDSADLSDPDIYLMIQDYLPGYLRIDESLREQIDLTKFPSIDDILRQISHWHGPLSFQPKWNLAHFVTNPDIIPPSSETLYEYRTRNKIPRTEIPFLWS
jgi:hypothetical protein